jgi:hypothetical protein
MLETRDDIRRFLEAIKRKEIKQHYKEQLDNSKTELEIDSNLHLLEQENCKLVLG